MTQTWWRGAVLKKAREKRELTQAKLAEKVGVHEMTISRLERGQIRELSQERLERLAGALEFPPKLLIGEFKPPATLPSKQRRIVGVYTLPTAPDKGDDLGQLVQIFQRLSPVKRAGLLDYALFLSEQDQLDSEKQLGLWLDEQKKGAAECRTSNGFTKA